MVVYMDSRVELRSSVIIDGISGCCHCWWSCSYSNSGLVGSDTDHKNVE